MTAKAERRSTTRPAKESRHRAREATLQMLYQWEVGRATTADVLNTFWLHEQPDAAAMSGDPKALGQPPAGCLHRPEAQF